MGRNNKAKNIGVTELAIQHGLDPMRVIGRLHCGWTLEKALNTPVRHKGNAYVLKNGQTLHDYCRQIGLGRKEYVRCCHLVKEKCLTPDEALEYHRTPKNPEWKKIKMQRQRVRCYGYTNQESVLPDEYIRYKGLMKQSKYHYKGKTLHSCCKKWDNVPYSTIRKICKHYRIGVQEAISNYRRKKMTFTCYRASKYQPRINYA